MTERTEWEVVDGPPRDTRDTRDRRDTRNPQNTRQTIHLMMKGLLGPHWRWKTAGVAVVAGGALLILAALTSMVILVLSAGVILSIGIGKLVRWLRRGQASSSLQRMNRHNNSPPSARE